MSINPTLAYEKARKMLLQAFDSGAEVLVFANDQDCALFKKVIAEIENEIGREISLALLPLSIFEDYDIDLFDSFRFSCG